MIYYIILKLLEIEHLAALMQCSVLVMKRKIILIGDAQACLN